IPNSPPCEWGCRYARHPHSWAQQTGTSFDQPIGCDLQPERNGEFERGGDVAIDHELEFQPSQPASMRAEIEAGAAAASVSARAFPDLWAGCRGRTRHGHAIAAALHVAERALRTFHRRDERRCRGWRQHGKNDEGGKGDDRAHAPSSMAHDVPTLPMPAANKPGLSIRSIDRPPPA